MQKISVICVVLTMCFLGLSSVKAQTVVDDLADIRSTSSASLSVGDVILVSDLSRGGMFRVASGSVSDDDGITIVFNDHSSTNKYARRILPTPGWVNIEWWGAVGDYNYATRTGTDNGNAIRKAVATRFNVRCGAGSFGLTGTIELYPQQTFTGTGSPQRASKEQPSMTELIWMSDTHGISTESHDANGAAVSHLVLRAGYQGSFTSSKQALHFGTDGATGGSSQQIKASASDVLTFDWYDGVGIHGYGYEVRMNRVLNSGFIRNAFRITDQSNIVSLYDCGGLGSAANGGDAKAFYISEAHQIGIYTPRMENNRVGMQVVNGASVNVYNAYCEGNRVIDFIIDDPGTTLSVDGARVFHENDNVTTTAVFSIKPDVDDASSLTVRNIRVLVTKDETGHDNDLTQFLLVNGDIGFHAYHNIDWQAVGDIYAGTGRAPDHMTFRQLPHLEIKSRGYGSSIAIGFARSIQSGAPTDALFTLTNYDSSTQLVGKHVGSRVYRMDASTVDFYHWDGSNWNASNK
ncbi:MAG: hypothetical protein CMJ19_25170 [Phycisphaeraceae bacterium]|nr:hypothetical protein [Phycisphaeraceae bacterium]